ncbi:MAG: hypothetical protein M3217_05895 [Actinomycetota bacterium]|nr:hypothetical protein [Actinomycetota bacterium]
MRVPALVLGAAVAVAAGVPLGCGGDDETGTGDLVWTKRPAVYRQPTLPRDRVLVGIVRNDSLRRIEIAAEDVRAVDRDGDALRGNATFVRGYIRPLYPPTRPPEGGLPESELERTGRKLRLEPGKTAPLSIAWRVPRGGDAPVQIDYGSGLLPIPGR